MTDIKGYRVLGDAEKELANEGKELEERYMRWLDKVHGDASHDPRSLALARTYIQNGAMWAIRSIFQPSRIKLPEDQP